MARADAYEERQPIREIDGDLPPADADKSARKHRPLLFSMVRYIMRDMARVFDELRAAIAASGMSRYAISRETGIAESNLSRFMSGERGLTTTALDTLAEYLNLNLIKGGKPYDAKGS